MDKKYSVIIILFLLFLPATVGSQGGDLRDTERVESFSSRIAILSQGAIEVTETIVLINHGENISWGFERLLPRWHRTAQGLDVASGYEILDVQVNNEPLGYTLTDTKDGLAVTVGDPNFILVPGRYVYTLSYRCTHLVDLHNSTQTLAWDVTGSWPVPLERVKVDLGIAQTPPPSFQHWSAAVGSDAQESWLSIQEGQGWLHFEATRPLAVGEAFVIKAAWPQGYVQSPPSGGRILELDSWAKLGSDQLLSVQERIRIINDGSFSTGFSRDFPGLHEDAEGKRRISQLEITQVQVNGAEFPWALGKVAGGQRLLLGSAKDPLPHGELLLTIAYTLDRQIQRGRKMEELSWQLPGFPLAQTIEQAKFTIELPGELVGVQILRSAFTRRAGETGSNVFHYVDNFERTVFAGAGPLEANENLVCSVAWPVGQLPPLSVGEQAAWLFRDNASAVVNLAILIFILAWYILIYSRRGWRPLEVVGAVIPPDISPALLRYLRLGVYDNRTFTAGVLSLAVKGSLMIVEEGGKYALVNGGAGTKMYPDEKVMAEALFAQRMAVFPTKDRAVIKAVRKSHHRELSGQARELLCRNGGWFYPLAALSTLGVALSALLLPVSPWVQLGFLGLVLWILLLDWIALRTQALLPALVDDWGWKLVATVLLIEVAVTFTITLLWSYWLAGWYDWFTVIIVKVITTVNAGFFWLLASPTPKGRGILEQALGFRQWLTQEGRPGGQSRFEKYLPHALALDVANHWGRRFGLPKRKGSFSPRWYQGSRWHTINAETLAASLAMMAKPGGK